MKNLRSIILLVLISFLLVSPPVMAQLSSSDRTRIQNQLTSIANSVNRNNIDVLLRLVAKDANPDLIPELKALKGKTIVFEQRINSFEDIGNNQVKVSGTYDLKVSDLMIKDEPDYFIFENQDNFWLLKDTNFHKKMDYNPQIAALWKYIILFLPIIVLILGFWLWMLIDAIKRDFDYKDLWIVLLIILFVLGAILYFIIVRRKLKQEEQQAGIIYSSQLNQQYESNQPQYTAGQGQNTPPLNQYVQDNQRPPIQSQTISNQQNRSATQPITQSTPQVQNPSDLASQNQAQNQSQTQP